MTVAEFKPKLDRANDPEAAVWSPAPPSGGHARRRVAMIPILITLATAALAASLGWATWKAYMGAPWTRDSTVRAYVVTEAPEVTGRIFELPVADNQFVHKDDLLLVIDPTDFRIALEQAEAAVRQAQANVQNFDAQITAQQAQIMANEAQTEQAQAALTFAQQQAARYRELAEKAAGTVQMAQQTASALLQNQAALKSAQAALIVAQRQIETLKAQLLSAEASVAQATAQRDQSRVNLERTQIRSPVNGWITNLFVRVGDYASVGRNVISIVDADSFWVDAYFEETQLASVREGDPVEIKLMGHSDIVRGQVGGVARAINVSNADPNQQGLANVNPVFTWVRLAQRVPVHIKIDQVPDGVRLVAGMTATVQVDSRPKPLAN